jgi:hypothetical protein
VLAEKARYSRSKPGEQVDVEMKDVPRRNSPESITATDDDIDLSVIDESIAASDTDYVPPSEHSPVTDTRNALAVKVKTLEMGDGRPSSVFR